MLRKHFAQRRHGACAVSVCGVGRLLGRARFFCVRVPLTNDKPTTRSLENCLENHFAAEKIRDYRCERCNKVLEASKSQGIIRLPAVIRITLVRSLCRRGGGVSSHSHSHLRNASSRLAARSRAR
jgi:ubiquitin C-terminal hydrolase